MHKTWSAENDKIQMKFLFESDFCPKFIWNNRNKYYLVAIFIEICVKGIFGGMKKVKMKACEKVFREATYQI